MASIILSFILAILNAVYSIYLNNKKEYAKANHYLIWVVIFIILILGDLMLKKLERIRIRDKRIIKGGINELREIFSSNS